MAVLELNGLSTALSGSFSATVIFPENASMAADPDKKYPALYFIHENGGNDTDIRYIKNLERLSSELGIFIIAPSLMHSFARDLRWGGKYGTFVSKELPGICRHMFPLDETRQYIGGTGSGAYAAYLQGAEHPDVFKKCIALDGHYNIPFLCEAAVKGNPLPNLTPAMLEAVFGDLTAVKGTFYDILNEDHIQPPVFFTGCQEDFVGYPGCALLAKLNRTALHTAKNEEDLYEAALRWL